MTTTIKAALLVALLVPAASLAATPVRPAADAGKLAAEVGQGKPTLLHFWATWCDACRDEFPALKATLLGLPARGVAVGLVSLDRPADGALAEEALARYGVGSLPSIILDAPKPGPVEEALAEPHWNGTLPATFLFDASGKKVKSFIGPVNPKKLERALRKLLRSTAARPPTAPPKG